MSAMKEEQLELDFGKPHIKDMVLGLAMNWGVYGITVAEVREKLGLHHGSASSALSFLEKEGHLVRLAERRGRCHLYVVSGAVHGRPVAPPRRPAGQPPGPTEDDVFAAFQRGRRNATEDALLEVQNFALQMKESILLGRNPLARGPHTNDCYRDHPECVAQAVIRFTVRKIDAQS